MDRIILGPEDRRYAEEFRASPFGPHSPRLQQIVNVFRAGPAKGKFVLIATSPHREWALGRLTGERACLVEVFEGCTFTSLVEAEWEVFKLRWVANRGPALDGETVLEPGEAVPARAPITLIGYADHVIVRPGETIRFMVSSETGAGYDAEIVRLICGDVNPEGPGYKEERVETPVSGRYRGRRQQISAGSYVVVPGSPALTSLSVAAMIWPTLPGEGVPQSLVANYSDEERRGFALRLDEAGAVALSVGDGRQVETVSTALPVRAREWTWVGATFDGTSGRAVVFQRGLQRYPQIETEGRAERTLGVRIGPSAAPVTLAAHVREGVGEGAVMAGHYSGKIDGPRLAKAALSSEDLERLQHEPLALGDDLLAAWDFGREIPTTRVVDVGPNALHGRTVNLPARAMKGWNWSGREMSWRHAPAEYGAIHFHDDDIYDAGWEADFELVVPAETRSGLYAARLKQGAAEEYIPFYVRPPRGAQRPDILFLAPTASYLAYGNFMLALHDDLCEQGNTRLLVIQPYEVFLASRPEFGRSLYDRHADGSGVFHFSRLQPNLSMRPKAMRWDGDGSSVRQFNADTHLLDWLEAMGHAYDIATDEDLHAEGAACLEPYRVVITGAHPEYHSTRMWEAIKAYTDHGGRLMYMGGNGFYWHIAFHEELPGVIEVRKAAVSRNWEAEVGEVYHAFNGELSGGFRSGGRPPQMLVGVGMAAMGFDKASPYRRGPDSFDPRAAFIFDGVSEEELIGDFGLLGGGAAGIEIDRADALLGTPPHALVVATSRGRHSVMFRAAIEELMANGFETSGAQCDTVRADMVYFETPNDGAVFSTGSIAWCGALSHNGYDNNVSRITDNVVRRFASGGSSPSR